jgi:hypothetical protein
MWGYVLKKFPRVLDGDGVDDEGCVSQRLLRVHGGANAGCQSDIREIGRVTMM